MKNKKIIFALIAVFLVACGYLGYVSYFRLGELKYEEQAIDIKTSEYQIFIKYPKITSGIPLLARSNVNRQIKEWVDTLVKKAKTDFESDDYKLLTKERDNVPLGLLNDTTFSIESDFTRLPVFSVYFETYEFSGGAHGNTNIKVFNFDAKYGELLTPELVFQSGYLNKLSKVTFDLLDAEDPSREMYTFLEEGLLLKKENFETYLITPDGIEMQFDQYQIGPYVIGRPSVLVLYQQIKEILTPRFLTLIKQDK